MRILVSAHHPQQLHILRDFILSQRRSLCLRPAGVKYRVIGWLELKDSRQSSGLNLKVEMSKQNSFIEDVKYTLNMVDSYMAHFCSS
jgi:hypothetical protein